MYDVCDLTILFPKASRIAFNFYPFKKKCIGYNVINNTVLRNFAWTIKTIYCINSS